MELDLHSMMTDPELANNPWPIYAGLREHAPALSAPFSRSRSGTVVILSRHDDIHQALRSHQLFEANSANNMGQKRPVIPLDVDPPDHAKYRKLLDPLFSPRAVQALSDRMRVIARELLNAVSDAGSADFHTAFTMPFPCRVFLELVGFPADDLHKFRRWTDTLVHAEMVAGTDDPAVLEPLMSRAAEQVYAYFGELLDRRAVEPADDLATRLVQASVDDRPLSRNEMLDILYLQMAAGLDTVTASLDCITSRLAQDLALQAQVRDVGDERRKIIEELLRVESPVSMVFRYATQDMEMHGVHIAKGDMVMMLLGAANSDDDAFPDPLQVLPERDNVRHMAFGGGVHRCLGSHLARLEISIALDEMFSVLGEFGMPQGEQSSFMPGIRTATALPLVWTKRSALSELG